MPGKSALVRKLLSWLLIIPACVVGVLLIEVFGGILYPSVVNEGFYKWYDQVIFFDGRDTIFQNIGDIFTYVPDSKIRDIAGFISDKDDFNVSHDYYFRTNNFGLVQDADIIPGRDSLLLLGDSFTEGYGTEPWFRQVSPEIGQLGYQAINGGLVGTGFAQWLKLDRYLADKNIRIRKLVVLFIADDYQRPVWNFNPAVLRCLTALSLCHFGESVIYRLPPAEELPSWIGKIRDSRGPLTRMWLKRQLRTLLPVSYDTLSKFYSSVGRRREKEQSRSAIAELVKIHGPENVAFVQLPQNHDIDNEPNWLGLLARGSIEEAGGKLFDGSKICGLKKTDYRAYDGHPNRQGYAKIAACVTEVIKAWLSD
jgi:hypothetical protein